MRPCVYTRISGHDDERTASLETQAATVAAFVKERFGVEVAPEDIYTERYTGTNLHDRPELTKLRQGVLSGRYQLFAVYCLDRLSRRGTHLAVLFDEAERHGCSIVSATEEIDKTPEGELMRSVKGYVAEVERLKILDRTQRGTRRLLDNKQLVCSGVARFGYRYDKESRSRVIVDDEADVVRRIFDWASSGWSIRHICQTLNTEGVKTPSEFRGKVFKRGKTRWVKDTIGKILRDRSYIGEPMVWNKTRVVGRRANGRAEVEFTSEADRLTVGPPTPRLVDDETFLRAGASIGRNRTYSRPLNDYKLNRMLTGMIFCGRCGRTLTTQKTWKWKKRGHYHWYICLSKKDDVGDRCDNARMQVELVEAEVWRQVESFLRDKDGVARALAATRDETGPLLEHDLDLHRAAIVDAEKAIGRLVKRLGQEEDDLVARAIREELAGLSKSVGEHRAAIGEIEARIEERSALERSVAAMQAFLGSGRVDEVMLAATGLSPVGTTWDALLGEMGVELVGGEDRKRQVLQALGAKVFVTDQVVRVELAVPVAALSGSGSGTGSSRGSASGLS